VQIHLGQIRPADGMSWLQFQGPLIALHCIPAVASHLQDGPQIGMGVGCQGLQGDGLSVPQLRLGQAVEQTQCIRHAGLQGIIVGRQGSGSQAKTKGFMVALLLLQEVSWKE